MDLTVELIRKIEEMAQNKLIKNEETGEYFDGKTLKRIDRKSLPVMETADLNGLVNAVKSMVENKSYELPLLVNVTEPKVIKVYTSCKNREQEKIASAYFVQNSPECINNFVSFDDFMLEIASRFIENEDREKLLRQCSKISSAEEAKYEDDGITQKAVVQKGVSLKEEKALQKHFKLKTFRTFLEIEQPESLFLLRIKKDGIGLFTADGDIWQLETIENIREYLSKNLSEEIKKGLVVII